MTFFIFRLMSALTLSTLVIMPSTAQDEHAGHTHPQAEESEILGETQGYKYVCPMHPQIVRDHEGTCPICGMDLVKQFFEQRTEAPTISVGGGGQGLKQELAIRTTEVQKTTLWKYIPTFGRVVADESKVIHIHPRSSGWISGLTVRSNGERVNKGQLLYKLYAPEIVSAQQDLLLAVQNRKRMGKQADSLLESARVRLELLGVSTRTVRVIEKRRYPLKQVPIYASQSGVISNLTVQNGMYVQPQSELMSIADLSSVWVEAEVMPLQQDWIKQGLTANVTTAAYPGQRWESQIDYLYPLADEKTQATKVRLPLHNSDEKLKPNMLMDVEIYGGPKADILAIPLEAVIDDGQRKRVVKQLTDGRFQVVEVVTGMETRGIVEVVSGVSSGERIVISGQFLIDSESQVQENLRRLMHSNSLAPSVDPHAGHQH